MQLAYQSGMEKPRFIVSAFQSFGNRDPVVTNPLQTVNNLIFNGDANNNMVDVKTIIVHINGKISTTVDFDNNLDTGKLIR